MTIVLIIMCGIFLLFYYLHKEDKKEQERAEEQKKIFERETERLQKSDFIRRLDDAVEKYFEEDISKKINEYIKKYNHCPSKISDVWHTRFIKISTDRVFEDDQFADFDIVFFRKIGYRNYENMNQVKPLRCALCKYSNKWIKSSDSRLQTNDQYWDRYVQKKIDSVCFSKGVKPLKKI